jgi:hypothetical protein
VLLGASAGCGDGQHLALAARLIVVLAAVQPGFFEGCCWYALSSLCSGRDGSKVHSLQGLRKVGAAWLSGGSDERWV